MRPFFHLPSLLLMIALLPVTLLLAGCAQQEPRYDLANEATPALWRIDTIDGARAGYLFGTVHLLPEGIDWQTALLKSAMDQSNALVIEVLGADDAQRLTRAFHALAFSPGLPPVEARLPPDLDDELAAARDDVGAATFALDRMESWAAALTLASAQHDNLGLDRDQGVEARLQLRFAGQGKPVRELETIEQQLGAFDTLSEMAQRRMLRNVVADTSDVRAEFEKLLQVWASGDIAGLVEASQGGMMEAPDIREAILVTRNRAWASRIDAMLKRGDRPFIAVGAGHLVGPDNVRELLEAKGYRVVRVQ